MDQPGQYVGEIGVGDGWWLVFPEVYYDDVVLEDGSGPTFGNEHRIVMPQLVPVARTTPVESVIAIAEAAAAKSVAESPATVRNLGVASGNGWRGSVAVEELPDAQEHQLIASMAAAGPAYLILTVRFRTPEGERGAHQIIRDTFHDPDSVTAMNAAING